MTYLVSDVYCYMVYINHSSTGFRKHSSTRHGNNGLTHSRTVFGTLPPIPKIMPPSPEKDQKKVLKGSEAAKEVRIDFYRSVEDWISREMESNPDNLTGLAVLLADEVLHLTRVDKEIISLYPKIIEGLRAAFSINSKKFEELDDRLDTHHREFQKDLEDLDFRVVREKEVFQDYLQDLAHSEEYYFLSRRLKKIYDVISEIVQS